MCVSQPSDGAFWQQSSDTLREPRSPLLLSPSWQLPFAHFTRKNCQGRSRERSFHRSAVQTEEHFKCHSSLNTMYYTVVHLKKSTLVCRSPTTRPVSLLVTDLWPRLLQWVIIQRQGRLSAGMQVTQGHSEWVMGRGEVVSCCDFHG